MHSSLSTLSHHDEEQKTSISPFSVEMLSFHDEEDEAHDDEPLLQPKAHLASAAANPAPPAVQNTQRGNCSTTPSLLSKLSITLQVATTGLIITSSGNAQAASAAVNAVGAIAQISYEHKDRQQERTRLQKREDFLSTIKAKQDLPVGIECFNYKKNYGLRPDWRVNAFMGLILLFNLVGNGLIVTHSILKKDTEYDVNDGLKTAGIMLTICSQFMHLVDEQWKINNITSATDIINEKIDSSNPNFPRP